MDEPLKTARCANEITQNKAMSELVRCAWAERDPLYEAYHDTEWGVPSHDDRHLFEMLTLEGAQAGLSWITILRRRDGYRRAFDDFDPEKIVLYDSSKVEELMQDTGIIRNRAKILSTISNARAYLELRETTSLDSFLWQFVDGQPIVNGFKELSEIPAQTPVSDRISKELKKKGFSFVGSTIIYAFMQACGFVNDHVTSCWRFKECG